MGYLRVVDDFQLLQGSKGKAEIVGAVETNRAVHIGRSAAVLGPFEIGVLENVIFFVHDGTFSAQQHDGVSIIQHSDFVRGQKLPACLLEILAVGAVTAFALAAGAVE